MAGEWTPTTPDDHFLISDIPGSDRDIKNNTATVIEKEHRELGDGNSGGEHLQGSAMAYVLATASAPTEDPAGTSFVEADIGRLWFDTTENNMKVLTEVDPDVWVTPLNDNSEFSDGGTPTKVDSDAAAMARNVIYKVSTSGFVTAWNNVNRTNTVQGLIGAANPPTFEIAENDTDVAASQSNFVSFFVPKDYYFEVTSSENMTINWVPFTTGGGAPVNQTP